MEELRKRGGYSGNIRLLGLLGWSEDDYWRVRNKLIDEGILVKGQGKGGTVRIVEEVEDPGPTTTDVVVERVVTTVVSPIGGAREETLYDPCVTTLQHFWFPERQITELHIEVTAHQGRRNTGGTWTRPDISALSARTFRYVPGRHLDVWTFEVKPADQLDVVGVFEAAARAKTAAASERFIGAATIADRDGADVGRFAQRSPRRRAPTASPHPRARRTPPPMRKDSFAWLLVVTACGCADPSAASVDAASPRDVATTPDAPAADAAVDAPGSPDVAATPDAPARADAATLPCITGSGAEGPDRSRFDTAGLTAPITEESCMLSNGAAATCLRIQLRGAPSDHAVGPFCPRNITDPASAAGLWISGGRVYDLDGAFVRQLATFYGDATWQLYDPATGRVRVTDTRAACEAAARPNVDPMYNNYCVECALSYVNGGVASTLLIPARPVARPAPQDVGNMTVVGAALNGVAFDPPAPVQAILAAHTIAAFDDCGGHVNLAAGYHYHAATGCSRSYPSCDGHAPLIGYAADGYAIHGMRNADGNEPTGLDACRGHTDAARGYHYHVASAGENLFIGCFHGYTVAGATGMMMTPPDGGMMPGGTAMNCAAGQTSRCCGDGVCDGPENATNCSRDCR